MKYTVKNYSDRILFARLCTLINFLGLILNLFEIRVIQRVMTFKSTDSILLAGRQSTTSIH
jgi:ABC-type protease/lipase transport system fused ATPase/permease subunit